MIDPVIDFSYIIKGSNDDRLCHVALDAAGNIYLGGFTSSPDFATTPSAAFGTPQDGRGVSGVRTQIVAGRIEAALFDLPWGRGI